jgi:hypothetical protein
VARLVGITLWPHSGVRGALQGSKTHAAARAHTPPGWRARRLHQEFIPAATSGTPSPVSPEESTGVPIAPLLVPTEDSAIAPDGDTFGSDSATSVTAAQAPASALDQADQRCHLRSAVELRDACEHLRTCWCTSLRAIHDTFASWCLVHAPETAASSTSHAVEAIRCRL